MAIQALLAKLAASRLGPSGLGQLGQPSQGGLLRAAMRGGLMPPQGVIPAQGAMPGPKTTMMNRPVLKMGQGQIPGGPTGDPAQISNEPGLAPQAGMMGMLRQLMRRRMAQPAIQQPPQG